MKRRNFWLALFIVASVLFTVGCPKPTGPDNSGTQQPTPDNPDKPTTTNYKITFDTDGGSTVSAITVEKDKAATKPADPTKSGYNFIGWVDENGEPFDWTKPITKDIKLKAKWEDDGKTLKENKSIKGDLLDVDLNGYTVTVEAPDLVLSNITDTAKTGKVIISSSVGTGTVTINNCKDLILEVNSPVELILDSKTTVKSLKVTKAAKISSIKSKEKALANIAGASRAAIGASANVDGMEEPEIESIEIDPEAEKVYVEGGKIETLTAKKSAAGNISDVIISSDSTAVITEMNQENAIGGIDNPIGLKVDQVAEYSDKGVKVKIQNIPEDAQILQVFKITPDTEKDTVKWQQILWTADIDKVKLDTFTYEYLDYGKTYNFVFMYHKYLWSDSNGNFSDETVLLGSKDVAVNPTEGSTEKTFWADGAKLNEISADGNVSWKVPPAIEVDPNAKLIYEVHTKNENGDWRYIGDLKKTITSASAAFENFNLYADCNLYNIEKIDQKNAKVFIYVYYYLDGFRWPVYESPEFDFTLSNYPELDILITTNTLGFKNYPKEIVIPSNADGFYIWLSKDDLGSYVAYDTLDFTSVGNIDLNIMIERNPKLKAAIEKDMTYNLDMAWFEKDKNEEYKNKYISSFYHVDNQRYNAVSGYDWPVATISEHKISITKPGEKLLKAFKDAGTKIGFDVFAGENCNDWIYAVEYKLDGDYTKVYNISADLASVAISNRELFKKSDGKYKVTCWLKNDNGSWLTQIFDDKYESFDYKNSDWTPMTISYDDATNVISLTKPGSKALQAYNDEEVSVGFAVWAGRNGYESDFSNWIYSNNHVDFSKDSTEDITKFIFDKVEKIKDYGNAFTIISWIKDKGVGDNDPWRTQIGDNMVYDCDLTEFAVPTVSVSDDYVLSITEPGAKTVKYYKSKGGEYIGISLYADDGNSVFFGGDGEQFKINLDNGKYSDIDLSTALFNHYDELKAAKGKYAVKCTVEKENGDWVLDVVEDLHETFAYNDIDWTPFSIDYDDEEKVVTFKEVGNKAMQMYRKAGIKVIGLLVTTENYELWLPIKEYSFNGRIKSINISKELTAHAEKIKGAGNKIRITCYTKENTDTEEWSGVLWEKDGYDCAIDSLMVDLDTADDKFILKFEKPDDETIKGYKEKGGKYICIDFFAVESKPAKDNEGNDITVDGDWFWFANRMVDIDNIPEKVDIAAYLVAHPETIKKSDGNFLAYCTLRDAKKEDLGSLCAAREKYTYAENINWQPVSVDAKNFKDGILTFKEPGDKALEAYKVQGSKIDVNVYVGEGYGNGIAWTSLPLDGNFDETLDLRKLFILNQDGLAVNEGKFEVTFSITIDETTETLMYVTEHNYLTFDTTGYELPKIEVKNNTLTFTQMPGEKLISYLKDVDEVKATYYVLTIRDVKCGDDYDYGNEGTHLLFSKEYPIDSIQKSFDLNELLKDKVDIIKAANGSIWIDIAPQSDLAWDHPDKKWGDSAFGIKQTEFYFDTLASDEEYKHATATIANNTVTITPPSAKRLEVYKKDGTHILVNVRVGDKHVYSPLTPWSPILVPLGDVESASKTVDLSDVLIWNSDAVSSNKGSYKVELWTGTVRVDDEGKEYVDWGYLICESAEATFDTTGYERPEFTVLSKSNAVAVTKAPGKERVKFLKEKGMTKYVLGVWDLSDDPKTSWIDGRDYPIDNLPDFIDFTSIIFDDMERVEEYGGKVKIALCVTNDYDWGNDGKLWWGETPEKEYETNLDLVPPKAEFDKNTKTIKFTQSPSETYLGILAKQGIAGYVIDVYAGTGDGNHGGVRLDGKDIKFTDLDAFKDFDLSSILEDEENLSKITANGDNIFIIIFYQDAYRFDDDDETYSEWYGTIIDSEYSLK